MSLKAALETIYTLQEAAEKMRLKPRTLAKFAQERGICSVRGRAILFSEGDLVALWEAMRCAPTSVFHARPSSQSVGSTDGRAALEKARKIMAQHKEDRLRRREARRKAG